MSLRAGDTYLAPIATGTALPILGQPTLYWRRLALGLILALAAGLEFTGLDQEGYANSYYAAGVKSMLTSWHNFFFVSFDAGGFVSLDKPPLGLWIEAASAKLFGFSGLSMLAPEALAGVVSVALLYHLVARAFGPVAGLLAAALLACTPISAIIDRNNTIDSLLILTLLLGVWAISLAAERASLRWLLLAALAVGLGFNIKMLQAYLVVPAFTLVYLLGARLPWRRRFAHLALAGTVLLIASFCWVAVVDLTPAAQRPFVSDSGTNSELSLVLGYNGLGRLTQAFFPGLTHISILGDPIDLTIQPGFSPGIGDPGPFRLLDASLGGQASWFLLPALAGLLALARREWPRPPLDRQAQALLVWCLWLLAAGGFFSTARFFHLYYLVMIAPPIAALAGIGLTALWREYRRSMERRPLAWRGWLLPVTLVGTALMQVRFLNGYPDWSAGLAALVIGGSLIAAAMLAIGRLRIAVQISPGVSLRVTPAIALGSMVMGMLALLVAPATWSITSVANGAGGAWLPQAGNGASFGGGAGRGFGQGRQGGFRPNAGQANGAFGGPPPGSRPGNGQGGFGFGGGQPGLQAGGGRGGFGIGGGGAMTFAGSGIPTLDPPLLRYLVRNQGRSRFLVATASSSYASVFILATGRPAMALGGYQGWDRILSLPALKALIADGAIRFFYLPAARSTGFGPGQGDPNPAPGTTSRRTIGTGTGQGAASQNLAGANDDLTSWVASDCAAVPAQRWRGASSSAPSARRGFAQGGTLQLYDCAGRASR